jgi:hypothetical protein
MMSVITLNVVMRSVVAPNKLKGVGLFLPGNIDSNGKLSKIQLIIKLACLVEKQEFFKSI